MKKRIIISCLMIFILLLQSGCISDLTETQQTDTTQGMITDSANVTEKLDSTVATEENTTVADPVTETVTNTQVPDTSNDETTYEYMDFIGWEDANSIAAREYFNSTDLYFEEGDTVPVDELMIFYTLCEMRIGESFELKEELLPYRTHPSSEIFAEKYEISIPKEIVNAEIEKNFAVQVDGTDSEYTDPENEDCYLLFPYARGGVGIAMRDYVKDGNRSTAVYAIYDYIDKRIFQMVELCIENDDSEEDFRFIYARKVG